MAGLDLTFGPIYCEDALAFTSFPVEPVNTISNLVIVMFGVLALRYVARRAPGSIDLNVMGWFLVANGIGSGLWHGLRAPWALVFDVLPGLVFLFGMSFCWARRLWSMKSAVILAVGFVAAFGLANALFPTLPRFVAIAPVVVLTAAILIWQTALRSRVAALLGVAAIAGTLTALLFRTIDIASCPYISVGTHFLWHIFNSAGAFASIVALVTLQDAGAPNATANISAEEQLGKSSIAEAKQLAKACGVHIAGWNDKPGKEYVSLSGAPDRLQAFRAAILKKGWHAVPAEPGDESGLMDFSLHPQTAG